MSLQRKQNYLIIQINIKMRILLIILAILVHIKTQSFTLSSYSVTPNYAKSTSSLYTFTFNANPSFTDNFDIRVYFPTQYTITAVTGCGFWLNDVAVDGAVCSVSVSTNEIVFTQLQIATAITSIKLQFRTSTARYSGSTTIIFYYYSTVTGTANSYSNYVLLSTANAIMPCTVTSNSAIVGDNITYALSYTPLVPIEANSVLQVQMQPWGAYSQSNFITTNVTSICNGACTLSVPASNGNVSELVRFTTLFGSETTAGGNINLARARNPASTREITISIVILAKISTFSQQQYMNCTSTFSVSTPNSFRITSFATTNPAISASNVITLRLQVTNPVSSISYIRIQPNTLALTYQFNNYNQGTQPFQVTATDGSMLIGNLTTSTTSSPSILTLNNFTLINPPYSTKPVTITFTTENLVDSVYYLIDRGTVDIVSTPSTITEFGITVANTSINAISRNTIWLKTLNRLISTSFIMLVFPSQISLSPSTSTCTLSSYSSTCSITNTSTLVIDINTIINAGSNLSVIVNGVTGPATTTPTGSIGIYSYYEDAVSLVDQLTSGFTVTATSVPLRSVQVSSSSQVVGALADYTVTVQNANMLPAGSVMRVKIPTTSFATTNIVLRSFSRGGTAVSGCTITTISAMYIQFQASCFPTDTPASTSLQAVLSNITNPTSTKPSNTWTVETLYNSLQMEYLLTGITVTMTTPAQITIFSLNPNSQTVNELTSYKFDFTFLFAHSSGDRVIITFPDGVLLNSGFQCTSLTIGTTVSCYQSSQTILEVTMTLTASSITQLSFQVSSIRNNWFSSTRTLSIQTTTNDSTYYYVQTKQSTINFVSTSLTASALSNEQIILLGQSTVKLTIASPFALTRATTPSLLYLTVAIPTDLTPISGSCTLSFSSANCAINLQNLNITGFGDFSTALTITFRANTNYFVTTSTFISQLYYSSSLIASDINMKLASYCTSPCKQCTSTPTQCLTCLPTPYTVNNTYHPAETKCVNVCPITYFASSGSCLSCNESACYGCTGNLNNCTSCHANTFLYQSTCLSNCPTQFYASNGSCLQCVGPCFTCSSATTCLSCIANYFLDTDSKCVLTCSNVSYIGLNGTCQLCTSNCLTCSRSLSNCTSCVSNQYLLFQNSCVRACSSGYYNNINSTCEACVYPCLTCQTRLICQSCQPGLYFYNGSTCTASCPPGTLGVVNTCETCNVKCATCSVTTSNCSSCAASLLFYMNQCVTTCPPLTYPYNRTCTTCIAPCVTCSGAPEVCLTCIDGLFLLNNTCIETCPNNGYYTSQTNCLPCTENCLSCHSLASCNLCTTGYYLLSGGCVTQCPDSHPIISNRQCLGCSQECATCSGTSTNCTSCTVFYFKYLYTCVKECPITYYSNTMTYQCESGLTSKIVFFPVLITSVVVIAVLLMIKCFTRETSWVTAVTAFLSPLELAIWCYVFSLMFAAIKEPDIVYTIPIVLLAFAIFSYLALAAIFFVVNGKKMEADDLAMQWATNNVNYAVCQIIKVVSLFLGCKFFRIIYSRLFNSITLSVAYRNRSNVFTIATIFSLCFLIFCQIPTIVACWSLVYSKTLKDQTFYTAIQGLVVTIIAIVFSLIDIYKSDDYFEESQFCKMKKYVEKIKDFSSMNKLEQGFEVSHEQGSVDAQRFVGTSGGKFVYTKQRPEDIKDDFYFQENEGVSQATDAFDNRASKRKSKMINIFAPIAEQEAQYYENQKFGEEQINTQAQLEKKKRKLKSIGSDEEQELTDTIQRKQQLGPDEDFDDTKSLLNDRQIKGKWNNIIAKRIELAQKIFNRHPPNLAQIDEPLDQNEDANDNEASTANIIRHLKYDDERIEEEGTDSQFNTNKKKKRKRKIRTNKQLEEIYLQRLTDKKQKSHKDMFTSDKSLKYDF